MTALLPCPFCGGGGTLIRNSGDYGYRPPTVWVACENSIFPKRECAAETRHLPTEEWKQGRGTYSVDQEATETVTRWWNTRASPA